MEVPTPRTPAAFELDEMAFPQVETPAFRTLAAAEFVEYDALPGLGRPGTPDPRAPLLAAPEAPHPD